MRVHSSMHPRHWRKDLLESFRARRMNHRFHYETPKQATRWLALHEAHSPARRDPACLQMYDTAFADIAAQLAPRSVQLISLGCGGGQKDLALLNALRPSSPISYAPSDVSLPLALTANHAAQSELPTLQTDPFLLDLSHTADLSSALTCSDSTRLVCLFGILPNFEPGLVFPLLAAALRQNDFLLLSANLAPGHDYAAGVSKVLPGYDNALTREWLISSLTDAGIEAAPSDIQFKITDFDGLKRIEAAYNFTRRQTIHLEGEVFSYQTGDEFRLFYSYRYTANLLASHANGVGLRSLRQWSSGDEGLFLLGR